ncbi:GNAT family N-acetyltransferase [Streptomyces sp. NPDC020681]|uniref:GNAT family N-acetyltransferase n=1 Tax=Streptomyces sp. NPDC020681 TaxID=3365083 RepID=UPI0037B39AD6
MTFTVRPATPEDAPAVCALLNAVDVIEIGRPETDLSSVETDLTHPEADLPHNSWLGFQAGELVAYGLLWDDSGAERIDIDHYVLPEHQAAGERLLVLMEARAAQRAAGNGADRAVVHFHLNVRPTLDTSLLTRRGWRTVRRYNVLTRPLSPAADPVPAPPPGLTLRDCRDEADRRRAHALIEEAFAEHYDHQERTYQQWLDDRGKGIDWSLVWLASLAGSGDVGVVLTRGDREAMGWIQYLGVRKEARGRGIASHLLRHAFGVYAQRGRDTIGLGVDTGNATGALRLYESHGMALHFAADTWEVTLPAGPAARPDGRG